jgi:hypothetical protein
MAQEVAARKQGDADTLAAARSSAEAQISEFAEQALAAVEKQVQAEAALRQAADQGLAVGLQQAADKLAHFRREGNNLFIEGANLFLRNGLGSTGTGNGLGNLILGYNEERPGGSRRNGSHNLVIGPCHNFTHFGGLVVGDTNEISAPFASVVGGAGNTAGGLYTVIGGGMNNVAAGLGAAVSGGRQNMATGECSTLGGGLQRQVTGLHDWRAGTLASDF